MTPASPSRTVRPAVTAAFVDESVVSQVVQPTTPGNPTGQAP